MSERESEFTRELRDELARGIWSSLQEQPGFPLWHLQAALDKKCGVDPVFAQQLEARLAARRAGLRPLRPESVSLRRFLDQTDDERELFTGLLPIVPFRDSQKWLESLLELLEQARHDPRLRLALQTLNVKRERFENERDGLDGSRHQPSEVLPQDCDMVAERLSELSAALDSLGSDLRHLIDDRKRARSRAFSHPAPGARTRRKRNDGVQDH